VGIAVLRCDRALKNFKLNYFSIKGLFLIIFGCSLLPDFVLSWLTHSNGNLSDFERLIAETADQSSPGISYQFRLHRNDGSLGVACGLWGNMELLTLTLSFPCNRKRYLWGGIDTTKQFQPLIEPQPIAQSKVICGKLKYKHRYLKNICVDRR
jgi:hypothetical protein